jgi:outer membrane receptor protein involved in Fe transport
LLKTTALRRDVLRAASSALALGTALFGPGVAFAQDTADVGEVVVTASRIQSAGFTAPTPTSVLGSAEIARRAPVTVLEAVNDIPSFRPSSTPQNSASTTNGAIGNPGSSLVDLRGLGNARTLLLINGHRTGGSQDLGQFPTILVSRIDVVTGGASAAYGSDAVAGVVNIVLDTKFEGLKGDVQYGQSKYGDDETWVGSLAFGKSFWNDRAHILVGGSYMDEKGALTANPVTSDKRPWIADNRGAAFSNPCPRNVPISTACPTGGNGLSPFVDLNNHNFATMNPGGVIVSGPLKGITFEDGGLPRPFQYGIVLGSSQIGGEGLNPSQFALRPDLNRYVLMGRFDFKVSDTINLWAEYSNARTHAEVPSSAVRDQGNLTIRADNAFIPAVIRAAMQAQTPALTTLTMGRFNNDRKQPLSMNTTNVFRYAGGLDGTFGAIGKTWNWDIYAQYGINHSAPITYGSRNTDRWLFALDSVMVNGVPQCRAVTQNNPVAAGCVPFNIFGPNAASQAAIDYIRGNQWSNTDTTQTNAAFNIRGEPFSLWAGPVALAFGGEYRREKIVTQSDPLSQLGKWDSGNTKPLSGSFNVKEVYAEVAVPLAKDMPFARSLDFNGAVRYADYSSVRKGVTTWKVGGTWEPVQEILLRTTLSRDIRAPSINNLYAPGGTSRNNVVQRTGPLAGQNGLVDFTSAGNPNLTQENADTWTAGFSLRPRFTRLRFSADYFSIKIKDQIGTLATQAIIDLCTLSNRQDFCRLITFSPNQTVLGVLNTSVNNASFTTRGWDLEASYVQPLGEIWEALPGTLTARAFATKVLEYAQIDQSGYVDRSGQNAATLPGTTNVPEWVANYTLSYEVGRFTGGVQFRYIGPGVLEKTSITGTSTERMENKISSQTITNFSASYRVIDEGSRRLVLYGAVNNAFNRGTPFPIFPLTQNGYGYDNLGMVWRAGLRFQY